MWACCTPSHPPSHPFPHSSHTLSQVENTIRWRYSQDEHGNDIRESNARIVRWSDGSMSLYLGSEIFDICRQPLSGEFSHLFVRQGESHTHTHHLHTHTHTHRHTCKYYTITLVTRANTPTHNHTYTYHTYTHHTITHTITHHTPTHTTHPHTPHTHTHTHRHGSAGPGSVSYEGDISSSLYKQPDTQKDDAQHCRPLLQNTGTLNCPLLKLSHWRMWCKVSRLKMKKILELEIQRNLNYNYKGKEIKKSNLKYKGFENWNVLKVKILGEKTQAFGYTEWISCIYEFLSWTVSSQLLWCSDGTTRTVYIWDWNIQYHLCIVYLMSTVHYTERIACAGGSTCSSVCG